MGHHWLRRRFGTEQKPSHYLNQWWLSSKRPISPTPQCTCSISHNASFTVEMHTSVLNGALWDMEQMHCGVCSIWTLKTHFCEISLCKRFFFKMCSVKCQPFCLGLVFTPWSLNKMAYILQTAFESSLSWIEFVYLDWNLSEIHSWESSRH